jgi:hypothetical protein
MVEGRVKLRRVGIWSIGKISAILGAIWGLIYGLFIAAFSSLLTTIPGVGEYAGIFGVIMIVVGPVMGAIGGLIYGVIAAGLYNIAARLVGGIEMKFE